MERDYLKNTQNIQMNFTAVKLKGNVVTMEVLEHLPAAKE